MDRGTLDELPPPGVGLLTLMDANPSADIREASTVAVSCEELTNAVGKVVPFSCTVEAEAKPDPFTVSTNELDPANTNSGAMKLKEGGGLKLLPETAVVELALLLLMSGSPCGALTLAVLMSDPGDKAVTITWTVAEPPEAMSPKLQRITAPPVHAP